MHRVINRFIVAASVVGIVASSAACARQGTSDSTSPVAPSSLGDSEARGGGKPGGGGTTGGGGTISLVMVTDNNGNGTPNWNDTVTFNVSTTATASPYVFLNCYQNNVVVAGASAGFFDSYPWSFARLMTLSSRTWTGGAADCKADLGYYGSKGSVTVLASLPFHVDP